MANDYRSEMAPVRDWTTGCPRINLPAIHGAGRRVPFFLAIPATGTRPMTYTGEGLPIGAKLDPATGFITGRIEAEGEYEVRLRARNVHGENETTLRLVIGGRLALTPPIGWNSWNCWGGAVTAEHIRKAADAMVATGLAARGYTYINIDSSWQGERFGPLNAIQGNHKFPDMKGLVDHVHGLGLKAGIYSTPWTRAWGGNDLIGESSGESTGVECHCRKSAQQGKYVGKTQYEPHDARQWAEWGFDYLKYDWVPTDPPSAERMRKALESTGRDFLFSVTTDAAIEHAAQWVELVHLWRCNPDTRDTWKSVITNGFFTTEPWEPYTGPGHWFDADMLVVGRVGWGKLRDNGLTFDEQMTHMTLWALLASPLFLGCDLEALDDMTLRLIANEEVIAIHQDPLGRQGYCLREWRRGNGRGRSATHERIYAKPLANGKIAVGFFNLGESAAELVLDLADLDGQGPRRVRNAWKRTDIGEVSDTLRCRVPGHGARLFVIA
jgi:alpha-galactosidase